MCGRDGWKGVEQPFLMKFAVSALKRACRGIGCEEDKFGEKPKQPFQAWVAGCPEKDGMDRCMVGWDARGK